MSAKRKASHDDLIKINMSLDPQVHNILEILAKSEYRTTTSYCRTLLLKHIDSLKKERDSRIPDDV